MRRPAASVVILCWNAWDASRLCLEQLRPTLSPRDEVIVVDNASTDGTPAGLRRFSWVRVTRNETNRGFAGGCNDGARLARNEVLVFLNNDTVPVGRWLDALLAPFADPAVGAAGPRSNMVSGPQLVPEVPYRAEGLPGLRRFVRTWESANAGRVEVTGRLVGFCLAVRRSAFERIGGFDERFAVGSYEDDDLCRRLVADGWRLLIAHGSFVHHQGHATFEANGLDWTVVERSHRPLFLAKHATIPVDAPRCALVVGPADPTLTAALAGLGLAVHTAPACPDPAALERLDPRPELVVAVGDQPSCALADVPVCQWGGDHPGDADLVAPAGVDPGLWLPGVLADAAHPGTFGGALLAARRRLEAGDLPGAIEAVGAAQRLRPDSPQVLNAMAVCAHLQGLHDEAVTLLERTLTVAPGHTLAAENLGALLGAGER